MSEHSENAEILSRLAAVEANQAEILLRLAAVEAGNGFDLSNLAELEPNEVLRRLRLAFDDLPSRVSNTYKAN
jgi:hypothetical protein